MPEHSPKKSALSSIRKIDYTVIFVRNMKSMKEFYERVLGFQLDRELSPKWLEFRIGENILALAEPTLTGDDSQTPQGSASLQLAFKVTAPDVDRCAEELAAHGVTILSPPTNQSFGHRTLFFRDPDGNLLEIYAEI